MRDNSFSKQYTLMTKGVLAIMLLMHHVLALNNVMEYGVKTLINDYELLNEIVTFCKTCIAGFAFITAFGMTRIFMKMPDDDPKSLFLVSIKRLVKLELTILIVFVLAILYKRFVLTESIRAIYIGEDNDNIKMLLYMFIDAIGMAKYAGTPTLNITWWYLSFAILLIIIMPFIYKMYQKYRWPLLPVACLLPYVTMISSDLFSWLFPISMLGTAFGYEGWFEKSRKINGWKAQIAKLVISVSIVYFSFLLSKYVNLEFSYTLAFIIPYLVYEFISYVPLVKEALSFIGKNATNIFLIHTFIYYYFYTEFVYSFHYSFVVLLVVLVLSVGISLLIEWVKNISGYNRLVNRILKAVDDKVEGNAKY